MSTEQERTLSETFEINGHLLYFVIENAASKLYKIGKGDDIYIEQWESTPIPYKDIVKAVEKHIHN